MTHTSPPPDQPVVEARALRKNYGSFEAVRSIDFAVQGGERLGFLGPNGAGKTTTMKMVTAFSPITAGTLTVFGLDVATHPRAIKARLGVVPQHDNLDRELTVEENLVLYARFFGIPTVVARKRARELLDFMVLTKWRDRRPPQLSGGMSRRVVIARSLINSPELLVLDEPTTGLDPQARRLVWDKLRSLEARGVTLILTTHYMEEAERLCDRLVVMNHGQILARGTPNALVAELVGRQIAEVELGSEAADALVARWTALTVIRTDSGVHVVDPPRELIDVLTSRADLTLTLRPANLEDVFVRLAGQGLSE